MKSWSLYLVVIGLLLGVAPPSRGDFAIYLDDAEQAAMTETFHYALEHNQLNQQSSWFNPDTGHSGTIMPVRSFYSTQGLSCREYFRTLQFDDNLERRLGIACRQPDGVWEVEHEQLLSDAYLELENSPDGVVHDPFDRYYPWVYYDPFDYPYPIYFSFVFVSHRHHYQPRHFHSGHRFNTHLFRDGRHLAPRQRIHRDQRPDPPLVRQQPSAPRFDRGTAPPRQRGDDDGGREQRPARERAGQRDQSPRREVAPSERQQNVDTPRPRPTPVVTERPAPTTEPADNRERLNRGERRQQPADTQVRQNRKSETSRDAAVRAEQRERSERQVRSDDDSRDNNRGQRGKEGRRSERRDRGEEGERGDGSSDRDRR